MPRTKQNHETWTAPAQGSRKRVLTQHELRLCNTGKPTDPITFRKRAARTKLLLSQTQTIAEKLEQAGISARKPSDLVLINEATGAVESLIEWRSIRMLPLVAQRDRANMINDVNAYIATLGYRARYLRYAVVTSGSRIEVGGDLRGRMAESTLAIAKFAKIIWKKYQIELDLLRKSGEFFVMKEDLDDQTEAANEGI